MSSKINLQTCEYARKSSIFQDNQLILVKTIKGFLNDALDAYKSKYRVYTIVDNYAIYFIPALLVLERK